MFRNQYDSDVTVWSPQGRLHQVEYAMEAVKLGSATVGLKNKTHAVLIALKRASSELSAHQKKIFPIDKHMGISISGLTADARMLSRYMRTECLNYKYSHDDLLPVSRLLASLGNKLQTCTQRYDRRPYGVGLLIAGYDDQGPHIYQTCPSSNYFDCKAMAIGARSQSARTYLEKHLNELLSCDLDELIKHGLRALRDTLPNEVDLSVKNVSIAVVGKGTDFKIYDEDAISVYLSQIEDDKRSKPTEPDVEQDSKPPQPPPSDEGPQDPQVTVAMDTD
ncbi:proteasome subunit alpha type-1 [Bombus vosnesenskii]|uniref:Proteasome subunit alpha type n=3 Tax=Pyrobombus TaxID=144703 RepID=A0A6J3L8U3_9HYME|nr:proteasome subunit alpha type-1 [Bombus impatiens]XP_033361645.1 proteasome subunit alpha type-1 [Bombus vosnesenskii]XP_043581435.1 proteasome subunit alpha type-1 [Bombus pyrosoma]XP_050482457.1 proteasome subunit alpha type-1 [Bombus huntii]XP_060822912.1 proteasome subunit alpha type-1-like [Bombus pascuorum]